MVKVSYEQKPFRKAVMQTFDANVIPIPSNTTSVGKSILEINPNTGGSVVAPFQKLLKKPSKQTVAAMFSVRFLIKYCCISLLLDLKIKSNGRFEEYPDIVIGCAGGGSNLCGLIATYMQDKLTNKANPRIIAIEPASCPSLTRGEYAYDFCDTGKITPLAKMYTLGSRFIPSPNHAGVLRYHGMSPILSKLYHDAYMEAVSVEQTKVFEEARYFAKYETILPASESAHAIRTAIDEAIRCKETGKEETILFGLTGTGYFDMNAYSAF